MRFGLFKSSTLNVASVLLIAVLGTSLVTDTQARPVPKVTDCVGPQCFNTPLQYNLGPDPDFLKLYHERQSNIPLRPPSNNNGPSYPSGSNANPSGPPVRPPVQPPVRPPVRPPVVDGGKDPLSVLNPNGPSIPIKPQTDPKGASVINPTGPFSIPLIVNSGTGPISPSGPINPGKGPQVINPSGPSTGNTETIFVKGSSIIYPSGPNPGSPGVGVGTDPMSVVGPSGPSVGYPLNNNGNGKHPDVINPSGPSVGHPHPIKGPNVITPSGGNNGYTSTGSQTDVTLLNNLHPANPGSVGYTNNGYVKGPDVIKPSPQKPKPGSFRIPLLSNSGPKPEFARASDFEEGFFAESNEDYAQHQFELFESQLTPQQRKMFYELLRTFANI